MARSAALAVVARRDRLAGERGCRAALGLLPLTCVPLRAVHHRASLSFYSTLLRLAGDGSSGGGGGGGGGGGAGVPGSTRPTT